MSDHVEQLKGLAKNADFFIGIDSDGCAFDSMEIKQKECFTPNVIEHWGLQPVARYAREACEFVNLYSRQRGCNRFIALVSDLDFIAERPEVQRRGFTPPNIDPLRQWIAEETRLGEPTLEKAVEATGDPLLTRALNWSRSVNATVERICKNVPPFAFVRESIEAIGDRADVVVVSATPFEALDREWREHDLEQYVEMICGQEMGSKKEHLQYAACGKYDQEQILMIGDAPGDMKAAKSNGVLFYAINPGHEEESWQRFHDEALDKFFAGQYTGDYERKVIDEFLTYLPETPPWKQQD
ncbi:MAG: HAD family hydrolase [Phycisphaerae bacterium]|nr:HAD family hydrolase [Phycisphaerae bacterium]